MTSQGNDPHLLTSMIFRKIAYILSIILIFLLPWRALITLNNSFTAARVIGALAGVSWISYLILHGKMRKPDVFHLFLFLFVVWAGLSSIWTIDSEATLLTFVSLLSGVAFCVVLWDLLRTREALTTAMFAYVTGCYLVILVEGYDLLILGSSRLGDVISGPNYIAARLIFAIPLAWYLVAQHHSQIRYIGILYIPIASISVLLTRSRQGIIALTVVLTILTMMYAHERGYQQKFIAVTIPSGIFLLVSGWLLFKNRFDSLLAKAAPVLGILTGDTSTIDTALGTRLRIYSAGFDVFQSNLLMGTGLGTFPTAVEPLLGTSRTPHSTYLSIATESGVVGLALFSAIILVLTNGILNDKDNKKMIGIPTLASYLVLSSVNTWFIDFTALFILTIILLSSRSINTSERIATFKKSS
jgi:O-antigen ligase